MSFSHALLISGFAIVSAKEAALFTDGRYFLQASEQLDSNWTLMKQGLPGVPTWQEYLVKVRWKKTTATKTVTINTSAIE